MVQDIFEFFTKIQKIQLQTQKDLVLYYNIRSMDNLGQFDDASIYFSNTDFKNYTFIKKLINRFGNFNVF